MFAIIRTGGKQVRVAEGTRVRVERLGGAVGDNVTLGDVLLVHTGEDTQVGRPVVPNASVEAMIVAQDLHRKVSYFKYKRRKGYRRHRGHRQPYTELHIQRINPGA